MQKFAPLNAPLKAPLNILVIVLLRKFSKELSKEHSKEQNFAPESGPWSLRIDFPGRLIFIQLPPGHVGDEPPGQGEAVEQADPRDAVKALERAAAQGRSAGRGTDKGLQVRIVGFSI